MPCRSTVRFDASRAWLLRAVFSWEATCVEAAFSKLKRRRDGVGMNGGLADRAGAPAGAWTPSSRYFGALRVVERLDCDAPGAVPFAMPAYRTDDRGATWRWDEAERRRRVEELRGRSRLGYTSGALPDPSSGPLPCGEAEGRSGSPAARRRRRSPSRAAA